MVASRMMADMIFARRMGEASSLIVALYAVSLGASQLVAAPLFFLIADLSPSASVAAVVNFGLVAAVWAGATFITALKDYWTITIAFAIGMVTAFVMGIWLGGMYQTSVTRPQEFDGNAVRWASEPCGAASGCDSDGTARGTHARWKCWIWTSGRSACCASAPWVQRFIC